MSANYQLPPRFQHLKNNAPVDEQKSSQRVIIPRGIVDPNQTTILEIPTGMENMPTIIAKKSQGSRPLSPARRQYLQNSAQEHPSQYSKTAQQEHARFEEKPNSARLKESMAQDKLSIPKQIRPNQQYAREAGRVGKEENYYESKPQYYRRSYPMESARQNEADYYAAAAANYHDQERASPYGNDERKSRSMKRYFQIPEEYRAKMNYQPRSPTMEVNKSLRIKRVLDRLDQIELQGLEEDLKNFQTARRKLIFDVSSMKMF